MSLVASLAALATLVSGTLLVLVVLFQEPRTARMAGALGPSGDQALGTASGRTVRRLTSWLATAWIVGATITALSV